MRTLPVSALAFITVMAFTGVADAREPRCVRPFKFCPGCSVDIAMTVKAGKACTVSYRAKGGVYGQETVVAPKHGRYGTANETATAYIPNPGYTGSDYFEARLYYELANGKRTFTLLKVNVNVRADKP